MRKFLIFPDGAEFLLADITYDEFLLMDFEGSSDTEYSKYLQERDMHTLDQFSDLKEARVEIRK